MGADGLVFLRQEGPAQGGAHAEQVEIVARDEFAEDLGRLAVEREVGGRETVGGHVGEDLVLVAVVGEVEVRDGQKPGIALVGDVDGDQFLRRAHREVLQEKRIDEREDRRVRPDAEGEGEDGDEREARGLGELADGELEVGEHTKGGGEGWKNGRLGIVLVLLLVLVISAWDRVGGERLRLRERERSFRAQGDHQPSLRRAGAMADESREGEQSCHGHAWRCSIILPARRPSGPPSRRGGRGASRRGDRPGRGRRSRR